MVFVMSKSMLDISSHLGERSYLPWEWEFPCRHIPPTFAATLGLDLPPLVIALIGAHRGMWHHASQKAHYFAYQLRSKANQHLATCWCLAVYMHLTICSKWCLAVLLCIELVSGHQYSWALFFKFANLFGNNFDCITQKCINSSQYMTGYW